MASIKDYAKKQMIDSVISFHGLSFLASFLDVPAGDETLVRQVLRDVEPKRLRRLFIVTLSDDEIRSLDEVRSNRLARPIRPDWEASLLDEPTEVERERAAVKASKAVNDRAPSASDVTKMNTAPEYVPVTDPTGTFVKNVHIKKWVPGPDGRPRQVELDIE